MIYRMRLTIYKSNSVGHKKRIRPTEKFYMLINERNRHKKNKTPSEIAAEK